MSRRTAHWMVRIALPAALVGLLAPAGVADTAHAAPAEGKPWVKLAERELVRHFYDISLAAEDDGWIVGDDYGAYAAHWDGEKLTESDVSDLRSLGLSMEAVEVLAPDDVWAVSSAPRNASGSDYYYWSRWDGKQWTHQERESENGDMVLVRGLRVFAADDVWVSGWERSSDPYASRPFLDHYDGTNWPQVELPAQLTSEQHGRMFQIDGTGGDDVWVATETTDENDVVTPYAAHWDGRKLTATELPVPDSMAAKGWRPGDVAVSEKNVWITGGGDSDGQNAAYTYDGEKWTDWKDRPLRDIFDMNVHPETGQMVAVGHKNGEPGPGDYATYDGNEWTVSPQAEDVPHEPGRVMAVTQAPESGRPMAVGYVDPKVTRPLEYLTSPAKPNEPSEPTE